MQRAGRQYYLTVVTAHRRILSAERRSIVLRTIVECHEVSMSLCVAVVMPDHVHFIVASIRNGHCRK